ncbi:hypothetical protein P7C73_g5428, partial [Tremellales sp. Uapishka_1]
MSAGKNGLGGISIDLTGDSDEDDSPILTDPVRATSTTSPLARTSSSSRPLPHGSFSNPSHSLDVEDDVQITSSYLSPSSKPGASSTGPTLLSRPASSSLGETSKSSPSVLAKPPPAPSPYSMHPYPSANGWSSSIPPSAKLSRKQMQNMDHHSNYLPPSTSNGASSSSNGASSSSAIDFTRPPPSPPMPPNSKEPVCIGAIMSRAIMLYPSPAVIVGNSAPETSPEKWQVVEWRGAEMLKVKLKACLKSSKHKDDGRPPKKDVIQVYTPGLTSYVGDLDPPVGDVLASVMARGLLRLEGFALRLQPEAPMFEVRVNVLLFTLRSNIEYISSHLIQHNLYLLDPVPMYDANRHNDRPRYENAHGGGENAYQMMVASQRRSMMAMSGYSSYGMADRDKGKQVEVQREQVDEIFKSLDSGIELEQSDPGALIKAELFPHQRKGLTFLLQREQDWSSLKQAKRNARKIAEKARKRAGLPPVDDEGKGKEREKEDKVDMSRSLWEGKQDEKGRIRLWKHKVTGQELKTKKGELPYEAKGGILADDMGLGKTLSVVSLIAATRHSAKRWGRSEVSPSDTPSENGNGNGNGIKLSSMSTKVFGMPDDSDEELASSSSKKGKKRKRDTVEDSAKELAARRSRITHRSKATLLVCPMSTITNWEEQIREHWDGRVEIVGGAAGIMPPKIIEPKWKPKKTNGESESESEDEDYDRLKIYIYHGAARRPDPRFISDFDVVITTYSTLANEFSKQSKMCEDEDTTTPGEDDTADNSDEGGMDVDGVSASDVADAIKRSKKKKGSDKLGPRAVNEVTSPLQAIDWFRVVLDEAHYIKAATTVASRASCALEADRRVALSGTPIQNKIEDVWALFKFLRLAPIDEKEIFTQYIASPCKIGEQIGVARLQLVMRCCTLRRTKDSTTEDGKRILNLPPRKETQLWLTLREDERQAYAERESAARHKVEELKGKHELSKNYASVLQEVLRLRQICDHVDLAKSGPVEEDYDGTIMDYEVAITGIEKHGLNNHRAVSVVCFLKDGDGATCTDCGYDFGDAFPSLGLGGEEDPFVKIEVEKKPKRSAVKAILTKCRHLHCIKCFKKSVFPSYPKSVKGVARSCGVCQTVLRLESDVIEVVPPGASGGDFDSALTDPPKRVARKKYVRPPGEKPNLSTKMTFLYEELMAFSKKNPNSSNFDMYAALGDGEVEELDADGKPYVTNSQWTTMLDRIGDMLEEANIKYARLDGTMTREERALAMEMLKSDKVTEVLLVSTRAGGVGLNLTAASRCYLVDPYWNPSVESQAIDRIHRLGQKRPVTAIKLMISDSVEQKLDLIQKKKANLATLSLKNMSRKEIMAQKVGPG